MNEFECGECAFTTKANDKPKVCPECGSDDIHQICPMCGSRIDEDTKVCPECKEAVA